MLNATPSGVLDNAELLTQGVNALRLVVDTLNSKGLTRMPSTYFEHRVRADAPTLRWGVGPYDINAQPPLSIESLSVEDGVLGRELEQVDSWETVRRGQTSRYGVTDIQPTRFYVENTWPVARLHFDIERDYTQTYEETVENNAVTAEFDLIGEYFAVPENPFLAGVNLYNPGLGFTVFDSAYTRDELVVEYTRQVTYAVSEGNEEVTERLRLLRTPNAARVNNKPVHTYTPEGGSIPVSERDTTFRFFYEDGVTPVDISAMSRPQVTLKGFAKFGIVVPQDDDDLLAFVPVLPPGFAQLLVAETAIHLSSRNNIPIPDAVGVLRDEALAGVRQRSFARRPVNTRMPTQRRRGRWFRRLF